MAGALGDGGPGGVTEREKSQLRQQKQQLWSSSPQISPQKPESGSNEKGKEKAHFDCEPVYKCLTHV